MSSYQRPYFERSRSRERGFRGAYDRRRYAVRDPGYSWRDEDDDFERGGRSRDPYESRDFRESYEPYDPVFPRRGESEFGRGRGGFEPFEEWQRPRELSRRPDAWRQRDHEDDEFLRDQGRYGGGSFAGRGPKGYQRSDDRLREEVCDRLTADPDIDASEMEVSVQNGEVTLQGSVRERRMKRDAEDCIESISGVREIHNQLRIEGAGASAAGEQVEGHRGWFSKRSESEGPTNGRRVF